MGLLSVCIIVKDEEEHLERCLNSVLPVADEIVVVDTGSTDRTVEIAESLGARVYHYPWDGSFANARNFGLEQATGEWILWIDADEVLEEQDHSLLEPTLRSAAENILLVKLLNYYGEDRRDPGSLFSVAHHRLFRNGKGIRFQNRIHERLVLPAGGDHEKEIRTEVLPVRIHHDGYLNKNVTRKNKHERNLKMLLLEKEEDSDHSWTDYHIASEYYRIGDYKRAFDHINQSIAQFLAHHQLPPSMTYLLKYAILVETGSFDGALEGIERALAIYPEYIDLHFYKGVILLGRSQYAEALEVFKYCRSAGDSCGPHLSRAGVGTFLAEYYMGLCYEKLGAESLAKQAFMCSANLNPFFEAAKLRLSKEENKVRGES